MTVVIDTCALFAHALTPEDQTSTVGSVLDSRELCLISPATIVEFYRIVYDAAGQPKADHWFNFLVDKTDDVRIVREDDSELLLLAAQALRYKDVTPTMALSAAIARREDAQVLTTTDFYWDIERSRFCEIRRL